MTLISLEVEHWKQEMGENFHFYSKTTLGILLNSLLAKELSSVSGVFDSKPMLMVLFNTTKHNLLQKVIFYILVWISLKFILLYGLFWKTHILIFMTIVEDMVQVMQFDI